MLLWPALVLVLGLFLSGTEATVSCGSIKCADNAFCVSHGNCQCLPGFKGTGGFSCVPNVYDVLKIEGQNNLLSTFYGSFGRVLLPCRVRLTEFRSPRSTGTGEECQFQIFGVNKIVDNHVQVTGFEVHFRLLGSDIQEGIGIRKETRIYSSTNPGHNKYWSYGKDDFKLEDPVIDTDDRGGSGSGDDEDGEYGDDEDDDVWGMPQGLEIGENEVVECVLDEDGVAHVDVPSCGVGLTFNGPHTSPEDRTRPVGLSVAVNPMVCPTCDPVTFQNIQTYLGETPETSNQADAAASNDLTLTQQLLHTSLYYAANQYDTQLGHVCEDTGLTYRAECTTMEDRAEALILCSIFLKNINVIGCIEDGAQTDDTGYKSLAAFKYCVWNSCNPSATICNKLKEAVDANDCSSVTPMAIQNIINNC